MTINLVTIPHVAREPIVIIAVRDHKWEVVVRLAITEEPRYVIDFKKTVLETHLCVGHDGIWLMG
jgi:hypothetical protein